MTFSSPMATAESSKFIDKMNNAKGKKRKYSIYNNLGCDEFKVIATTVLTNYFIFLLEERDLGSWESEGTEGGQDGRRGWGGAGVGQRFISPFHSC